MRKVKLTFWLMLAVLLVVVSWQNLTFLVEKKGVEIDYLIGNYHAPELQIGLYFLIFFLVGLLISYFSSLSERFVARKTLRRLKDELTNAGKKISDLEADLASRQAAESNPDRPITSKAVNVTESSAT